MAEASTVTTVPIRIYVSTDPTVSFDDSWELALGCRVLPLLLETRAPRGPPPKL